MSLFDYGKESRWNPAPASMKDGSSFIRAKVLMLCFLAAGHFFMTLFVIVPGYLSIDEAIYHFMVKNFSSTGGFEIWTGYQDYPSRELTHDFLRISGGRPVPQYPYLFPVLASPFYLATGFYGLFLLNSLAFVGGVVLCFAIAQELFGDTDLSLNSCLIFILCTFAWEYSQSAWPPATSLLLVVASFYLMVKAYFGPFRGPRLKAALAAGVVAGLAPGTHLTTFMVLPSLMLPFVFARPSRPLEAVLIIVGAIPGLAVLTLTNYIKFGVISPLSYGTGLSGFAPSIPTILVVVAACVIFAAWVISRSRVSNWLKKRRLVTSAGVMGAVIIAVVIPDVRSLLLSVLDGAYLMLIDLRVRRIDIIEAALRRTETGGLVYIGGLKKALFQSMPYLPVLLVPAVALFKRKEDFARLAVLFIIPSGMVVYFSYLMDHGGLSLNIRYFLPVLPFTSILTAYAIRDIHQRWGMPLNVAWFLVSAGCMAACFAFVTYGTAGSSTLEFALLTVPIFASGLLLVLLSVREFLAIRPGRILTGGIWAVLAGTLVWSGLVAFFYDYPLHRNQRVRNFTIGGQMTAVIPPDSVFFTAPYIDPFLRLIEKDRVRIALPSNDRFKDFPKLVAFYLDQKKPVFAAFPDGLWNNLKAGMPAEYEVMPVLRFPGAVVGEIRLKIDLTNPAGSKQSK